MSGGLTFWEKRLRENALLLAVVSVGFAVLYFISGVFGPGQYPFAANSVAKDLLLVLLAWLVFRDQRRWGDVAVPLIVLAHVALAIMLIVTLAGDQRFAQTKIQPWLGPVSFRWVWFASALLMMVSFLVLHHLAIKSRYGLKYLTPSGYRALMALSEVLVLRDDPELTPAEVATRVDEYLSRFRAREKYTIRLALHFLDYLPVATLHPPFHLMSVDAREDWIQRRFLDETRDWLVPRQFRDLRTAMIRAAQQFSFFGYYADPRAARRCGYLRFSERPEYEQRMKEPPPFKPEPLVCMDPRELSGTSLSAQVVVVGTGAGGAMLAHELARRGCDVLMLERGRHVEPETFTEDEAEQISNLYVDGFLQASKDFRFRIAAGMCVGGGTVVNNAVCFDLPEDVAARWHGPLQSGLESERLDQAFVDVRDVLGVTRVGPGRLNPGAEYFIGRLGVPPDFPRAEANIAGCLGCGYCNIGCAYGRKLSALDWTLPLAQQLGKGEVRVLPECRVERVHMRGNRAEGVVARLDDGRHITVRGQTVVLSAGAIASSVILQRSGLGGDLAGQSLSFNVASPVTLDFDIELHSERGLQISHYVAPNDSESHGVALESWWNPIVAQSLFMPGWFDEHRRNMLRYDHMTCVGVVIGSESNGTVRPTRFREGVKIDYTPTDDDFVKIKDGVRYACELGLRARARRAMPCTLRAMDISTMSDLARIDNEIGGDNDLSLNTSHPQGGNPISANPKRGVVDPEFRVYGAQNLFVCDASVFPSSITVNPQLTVMALASYAADHIADHRPQSWPRQAPLSISQAGASGPGS
jgi:choline dehydrogenase-like flavoprotein